MIGTTLSDIRAHIESLAAETGTYYLRCARTGEQPVPCTGLRFESRADARAAARATEQYRKALRRYDPRLPYHEVIVSEAPGVAGARPGPAGCGPDGDDTAGADLPSRTPERAVRDGGALVEFCHRVAGAVLEALSDGGFDGVEGAVMETYLHLAETVPDRDALCLRLLESIAAEFAARLPPATQRRLLADAASRLPPRSVSDPDRAVETALDTLQDLGVIGSYSREPSAAGADASDGERGTVVRVSGYALSATADRLPVVPIVLELYRTGCGHPSMSEVTALEDGWAVEIALRERPDGGGLANAPIATEGGRR